MSAEHKSLAVVQEKMVVTSEQMSIARQTVAKDLDDNQFALFCYNCQRLGVHPLDGLLVPILRNDSEAGGKRLTFVNTVDLLRSRAAETGDYAGSDDPQFKYELQSKTELPSDALVTVWKFVQGEKCSFSATARWEEYYPGDKQGFMWRNKPHVMLGKCAEALALRKAFPKQLAGLYIPEELQKEIEGRPVNKGGTGKQQSKPAQKATGDVMCATCRAVNGHLPNCPHRKSQDSDVQAKHADEPKPELLKWLVQVDAVDAREKVIKDKNGKETGKKLYLLLTGVTGANENVTVYAWHTGEMRERLLAIKPPTRCVFMVKPQPSGDKTYYNLESIVEISGEQQAPGLLTPDEE